MGKIFNALEKYRKERHDLAEPAEPLQQQDLKALLQFNRHTGRLNLSSRSIIKDPETPRRLAEHQLILSDGRITAAGERKCKELTDELRVSFAGPAASPEAPLPREEQDRGDADGFAAFTNSEIDALLSDRKDAKAIRNEDRTSASTSADLNGRILIEDLPGGDPKEQELGEGSTPPEIVSIPAKKAALTIPSFGSKPAGPAAALRSVSAAEENRIFAYDSEDTILTSEKRPETARPVSKPAAAQAIDRNMVTLLMPHSFEAEQFKILRTNLLYPVSGTPPRSVLVTSVNPGDGKSFVAANLAVSVALNINRYVLLLDCDLRKPTINSQFGLGNVPGLSEYLTRGDSLQSLLIQTKVERLSILPGGVPPPNPSELLSSNRMAELLQEVTNRYKDRLIIIDSPPPTMTAETGVLARMAEGIVLVARYSKTHRDELQHLIEHLGKEKIVGSVMNYFDYRSLGIYGYRYHKKYGGYKYY